MLILFVIKLKELLKNINVNRYEAVIKVFLQFDMYRVEVGFMSAVGQTRLRATQGRPIRGPENKYIASDEISSHGEFKLPV